MRRAKVRCVQRHVGGIRPALLDQLRIRNLGDVGLFKRMSVLHITLPPRYRHHPLYHARTHEWFYVQEGRTTVIIDGKRRVLRPGSFVYIAPGVPHVIGSGSQTVKVLVLFTPRMDMKKPDICLVRHGGR